VTPDASPQPHEVFQATIVGALALAHAFLGVLGFVSHRALLPATRYFTLACMALAWLTLWIGLRPMLVDTWPPAAVLSTLLSGYGGPAFLLFVWSAVSPRRPPSPAWLLLGLPGSLYSLSCLADPGLLQFVIDYGRGVGPKWHPRVSPFYLAHAVQLVGCTLATTALLVRGRRRTSSEQIRRSLAWLMAALGSTAACILVTTWLPAWFPPEAMFHLAPFTTLPLLAFSWRALRLQWGEARSAYVLRDVAETQRAQSVTLAVAGLAEALGTTAIEADAAALRLAAEPTLDAGARARVAQIREVLRRGLEITDRLSRFTAPSPSPAPEDVTAALRSAVAAASRALGRPVALDLETSADGLPARVDPDELETLLRHALSHVGGLAPAAALRLHARAWRPAVVPAVARGPALDARDAIGIAMTLAVAEREQPVVRDALAALDEGWVGMPGPALREVGALLRACGAAYHVEYHALGATLTLWLPAGEPAAWATPAPAPDGISAPDAPRVLLVGAERGVVEPLRIMLGARGVAALRFATLNDAYVHMRSQGAGHPFVGFLQLDAPTPETLRLLQTVRRVFVNATFVVMAPPRAAASWRAAHRGLDTVLPDTPLNELVALLTHRVAPAPPTDDVPAEADRG
jgi:hypothetical protein